MGAMRWREGRREMKGVGGRKGREEGMKINRRHLGRSMATLESPVYIRGANLYLYGVAKSNVYTVLLTVVCMLKNHVINSVLIQLSCYVII